MIPTMEAAQVGRRRASRERRDAVGIFAEQSAPDGVTAGDVYIYLLPELLPPLRRFTRSTIRNILRELVAAGRLRIGDRRGHSVQYFYVPDAAGRGSR